MSDDALRALAELSGVAPQWHDFQGHMHDVAPDHMRAVLHALGVAAGSEAEIAASLEHARAAGQELAPLVTAVEGQPMAGRSGRWRVALEHGGEASGDGAVLIEQPGYHRLYLDGRETTLAVAPRSCQPLPPGRPWGLAVQLYSLRREGDGGIGDFAGLQKFLGAAAGRGADAMAISPVHAQFSADPDRFSPYAPSSRIMLNVLHAPADGDGELERQEFVDWPAAARTRLAQLRRRFDAGIDQPSLAAFRANMGETLERHARFEALHAHFYGGDPALWSWRNWPSAYRVPESAEVAAFAEEHSGEVAYHAWLQMQADAGLTAAQETARAAGMRVGLISDLAVGADSGGSHAWSRQGEMMIGLSIGAPPDLLNTHGQNWGISAFSPIGLRRHGFTAFIEMLRAALRHAGGVRIDHAMGLQRLWVVPDGASAHEGAYLQFPVDDMMRLVALESRRHAAVVLGEDLGTVPDGFQPRLIESGVLGMRVLWFERDGDRFRPPGEWSAHAVAMTSTHDLPTVAGWWRGHDIDWREKLGMLDDPAAERSERARTRGLLWGAMRDSGAAQGEQPAPDDTWPAVQAALSQVARSECDLVLLPIEDMLARDEQPNLPATTTEHPNWRRRMPGPAEALLDPPEVAARLDAFKRARSG